ncbi:MAG: preprotein translocase subunit YajC [Dethiobacteria bacterium]|jgi:preprotein translocase subunit YajC|nr:preprotein translocase subunit YajC [Bacillota bacterium]HOB28303.1 preprotein translocase subunit YajC [Bacillota bacterium]HQD51852.1 preprotein translocase subunit YajC [Bacillota bacterium]
MEGLLAKLGPYMGIIWMVVIFAIFYFILIRPQQQQQKKRSEMLSSLQKGDRVVSIGGIYGVIKELRDDVVTLRVADNVNIKLARGGIERVIDDEEEE